jgi:hypothetical protein
VVGGRDGAPWSVVRIGSATSTATRGPQTDLDLAALAYRVAVMMQRQAEIIYQGTEPRPYR